MKILRKLIIFAKVKINIRIKIMAKEEVWTYEMLMQSFKELREQQRIRDEKDAQRAVEADKQTAEIKKQLAESVAVSDKEAAEIRKMIKELSEAADKRSAETDRQIKETNKMVNGIGKSNGAMAEEAIYNVLNRDKTFCSIKFDDIKKNVPIVSEKFETLTDLDVLLVNGDTIAIIETKYKVATNDVTELLENKLTYFRKYYPMYANHKIILGVGGMSFYEEAIEKAKQKGIGIIKVVGDKVEYYTENIKKY
jgi:hypothetical protein